MFDDDLIFDDFPRYIANLKDSRETKETFDTLSISATTNYIANLKDSREKKETFDNYAALIILLEKVLKRKIDIITESSLRPELAYVKKEAEYARL